MTTRKAKPAEKPKGSWSYDDFVAYRPDHSYFCLPTRAPWPASSVNVQLPPRALLNSKGKPVLDKKGVPISIPASVWLDKHQAVHQMTWSPAEQLFIFDKVVADGGWIDKPEAVCLNMYRPPVVKKGDARKVKPWLDHIRKVYPNDADHIVKWLAHRVQHPGDKINHALMLGGEQGIGKDMLLTPVEHAIGQWNFAEISPTVIFGTFTGHLKSVILRISEMRDLGDANRFAMYEHIKTYAAAPPPTHRVNEKFMPEHYVINCCGVIITTNHLTDGIYLPAEDRRHYVAWSELKPTDFGAGYFSDLAKWYENGGIENVSAYLAKLDLRRFDPKAPPPKTEAFWRIVEANRAPEESELTDIIEKLGNPLALTIDQVVAKADKEFADFLKDRRNNRIIPHRFDVAGYTRVRNSDADSGLWRIAKVKMGYANDAPLLSIETDRQTIYAQKSLSLKDQIVAATRFRDEAAAKAKANVDAAAKNAKAVAAVGKKLSSFFTGR